MSILLSRLELPARRGTVACSPAGALAEPRETPRMGAAVTLKKYPND